MKALKTILVGCVILGTAGCSTVELPRNTTDQSKVVYFPAIGIEASAEIGQTLVSKSNLIVSEAIELAVTQSESVRQSGLIPNSGTITIPAGKLLKFAEDDRGSYYRSPNGYYTDFLKFDLPVGVFVPKSKGKTAVLFVQRGLYEFGKMPIDYKISTAEKWIEGSFRSELIYGGLSQKTISISYREFSDGTARPAFTQELKYDLNDGDVIGFRGARFQVLRATNTSIRYKLLKVLD